MLSWLSQFLHRYLIILVSTTSVMKPFVLCFVFLWCTSTIFGQTTAPLTVLSKVAQKLDSIKTISYFLRRELNYPSERYLFISGWEVYCDFNSIDTVLGFRFQIKDSARRELYNGREKFVLNESNKTIEIDSAPSLKVLEEPSAFLNSIITLRNALPLLLNDSASDKTLSDTVINGMTYKVVAVNMHQRWIPSLGRQFNSFTIKKNWTYRIIIDQNTYLPVELLQTSEVNTDMVRTDFSDIRIDPPAPAADSWLLSTYIPSYSQPIHEDEPKMALTGSTAPAWRLQQLNSTKKVSLADFRGKVLLLDFWWKNCGPCIESTPRLVKLKNKFRNKSFEIASINFMPTDTQEDIQWYSQKNKVNYSVFLKGKEVAAKYGVYAAPTVFLINKKGKIIYAKIGCGQKEIAEIEKLIEDTL